MILAFCRPVTVNSSLPTTPVTWPVSALTASGTHPYRVIHHQPQLHHPRLLVLAPAVLLASAGEAAVT
jgi:hypothetical protein